MTPAVSIIIVTCNRAASLAATLESVFRAQVPVDLHAELIVVDNRSTDKTAELVRSMESSSLSIRYLHEARRGKSHGLNLAISQARGDILLFTDDDVRVPRNWVEAMCRPIANGATDATVGSIRMAAHLRRDWMQPEDFLLLACNEGLDESAEPHLVGANMAIARRVFEIVPGFDPEIGPGGSVSPAGEDTLLSFQMRVAGLRIARVTGAVVEHHFDAARLTRQYLRQSAANGALSDFYIAHHFRHQPISHRFYRMLRSLCRLQYFRIRRLRAWWRHPAMPASERQQLQEFHANVLHWRHRKSPRKYEKLGWVKVAR